MPIKISELTPIAEDYPDIDNVPLTATVVVSVEGQQDYEATLTELAAMIGEGSSIGVLTVNGDPGPAVTITLEDLGGTTEAYVDAAVAGVGEGTDFTTPLTLTHLAGFATDTPGNQSITNLIALSHMAQITTDSFLGRDTAGTGNVEVLSAAAVRTILDYGTTGMADVATAITALANDATAGIVLGDDVLEAILRKFVDNAGTVRAALDDLGVLYSTTAMVEGDNIVVSANGSVEVEGTTGINLAALSAPTAVTSSAASLTINWASGTKFRTHTTTENTTIASSGLLDWETARMIVTGGGAHTIDFPVGSRVSDGFEGGLTVASGEKYLLVFQYDGVDLMISVSTKFVEVV